MADFPIGLGPASPSPMLKIFPRRMSWEQWRIQQPNQEGAYLPSLLLTLPSSFFSPKNGVGEGLRGVSIDHDKGGGMIPLGHPPQLGAKLDLASVVS